MSVYLQTIIKLFELFFGVWGGGCTHAKRGIEHAATDQTTAFVRNGETTASLVVIVKEELDHDQLLIFSSTCQVTGGVGLSW